MTRWRPIAVLSLLSLVVAAAVYVAGVAPRGSGRGPSTGKGGDRPVSGEQWLDWLCSGDEARQTAAANSIPGRAQLPPLDAAGVLPRIQAKARVNLRLIQKAALIEALSLATGRHEAMSELVFEMVIEDVGLVDSGRRAIANLNGYSRANLVERAVALLRTAREPRLRAFAADYLAGGADGLSSREIEALCDATTDQAWFVRAKAVSALRAIPSPPESASRAIAAAASDPHNRVREAAQKPTPRQGLHARNVSPR